MTLALSIALKRYYIVLTSLLWHNQNPGQYPCLKKFYCDVFKILQLNSNLLCALYFYFVPLTSVIVIINSSACQIGTILIFLWRPEILYCTQISSQCVFTLEPASSTLISLNISADRIYWDVLSNSICFDITKKDVICNIAWFIVICLKQIPKIVLNIS